MRIYFAGKYQAKSRIEEFAQRFDTVSTWHSDYTTPKGEAYARSVAERDFDQIQVCDVFVLISDSMVDLAPIENEHAPPQSVGRYIEVGMAIALRKITLVPRDSLFVFKHLCTQYKETWLCLKESLQLLVG